MFNVICLREKKDTPGGRLLKDLKTLQMIFDGWSSVVHHEVIIEGRNTSRLFTDMFPQPLV